ncbi:MAG: hypothetical protein ACI4J5_08150 [Oscillospiraceae bacterium]
METIILVAAGLLLLAFGYLIGIKHKIDLVHSYHYKRVKEEDKPDFCRKIGLGNAIIGGAILLIPLLTVLIGAAAALIIAGIASAAAGYIVISTIIKYNKGLF